jgi:signal transduction histidine kinase
MTSIRPRTLRGRLFLATVASLGVALAVLVVVFNVLLERRLDVQARDVARTRAAARLSTLSVQGGRLQVPEAPDDATLDTPVWVFVGGTALEHPRAPAATQRAAAALAARGSGTVEAPGTDARLVALPVTAGGRTVGSVVGAVSLVAYEQTASTALWGSIALGVAVLALVSLLVYRLLSLALRPVARMTRDAITWSATDLDRRFSAGPARDEITALASTLDALLGRIAAAVRQEQRLAAELSHELRTPLARVQAEAELALRRTRSPEEYRSALESVLRNTAQLTRIVEALLAAARNEAGLAGGRADATQAARAVVAACTPLAHEGSVRLTLEDDGFRPVSCNPDTVERILFPVVENACLYASAEARIALEREADMVRVTVTDDGPGVGPDETEAIFEAGRRGAAGSAHDGTGLGLTLARRLARSAGGDVEARPGGEAGGQFVILLPALSAGDVAPQEDQEGGHHRGDGVEGAHPRGADDGIPVRGRPAEPHPGVELGRQQVRLDTAEAREDADELHEQRHHEGADHGARAVARDRREQQSDGGDGQKRDHVHEQAEADELETPQR